MARNANVDRIIEQILTSDRLHASAHFSPAVYGDEPILRTASQMGSFLPEPLREMRVAARRPEAWNASESWLFVQQARLAADVSDDFPEHVPFDRYYPTYQAMNDRQLRCYFTWRTRVRRGMVERTDVSYAYVYLYELINLIGCDTPRQAFDALRLFWRSYRALDARIDRYARTWLRDLALYHGLDPLLLDTSQEAAYNHALITLARAERAVTGVGVWDEDGRGGTPDTGLTDPAAPASPGAAAAPTPKKRRTRRAYDFSNPPYPESELFDALCALSAYRMENSRLFKEQPQLVRRATCAIFSQLAVYYRRNRKNGLTESLFGTFSTLPYRPFETAVFYEEHRHPDATWRLSPIDVFFCANGRWWRKCFHGAHDRSARLGRLLRTVDRELRLALDFPHPLKDGAAPKYLQKIVAQELEACLAWQQAHAPRIIQIDRSKLSGIRTAAASTREALLVDEERPDQPGEKNLRYGPRPDAGSHGTPAASASPAGLRATAGTAPAAPAPEAAAAAARPPAPDATAPRAPFSPAAAPPLNPFTAAPALTDAERALLQALLDGADPAPALADAGALPSVVVDQLNEKLFDVIGDAAVELDGSTPVLIEDYHSDVADILRETA